MRTDQNASSSVAGYKKAPVGRSKTVKNHRVKLGSNYGGHLAKKHHTMSHNRCEKTFGQTTIRVHKIGASSFTNPISKQSRMTEPEKKKGLVGLQNLGFTCYGNAALQSLRHVQRLCWIFTKGRFDTLFKKDAQGKLLLQQRVAISFADVLEQQDNGVKGGVLRPAGFWKMVRDSIEDTVYEQFRISAPHDAHEFIMYMLETLHESLAMEVDMQIVKKNPKTEEEKRQVLALETWKQSFTKEYSPLVDLFYGLFHVQIICKNCNSVSHKWETFNTIKVSVPKNTDTVPNLLDLMTKEFEGEEIEGYHCEKCSPTRTTAQKLISLWRLPQTLILCMKRFSYDGRKIHTKIQAPWSSALELKTLFSKESPEKDGMTSYSLRSIVDHHGGSGGGHYTAQCKDKLDDKWHVYDDESVHSIKEPTLGESTYVLFYEKLTSDSQKALPSHP